MHGRALVAVLRADDLDTWLRRRVSKETLQSQKRPTTVSKETMASAEQTLQKHCGINEGASTLRHSPIAGISTKLVWLFPRVRDQSKRQHPFISLRVPTVAPLPCPATMLAHLHFSRRLQHLSLTPCAAMIVHGMSGACCSISTLALQPLETSSGCEWQEWEGHVPPKLRSGIWSC
jgi:hypothetical protein